MLTLAQLLAFTDEQWDALPSYCQYLRVEYLSNCNVALSSWPLAKLQALTPAQCSVMCVSMIVALTPAQLNVLTRECVTALPAGTCEALSKEQLNNWENALFVTDADQCAGLGEEISELGDDGVFEEHYLQQCKDCDKLYCAEMFPDKCGAAGVLEGLPTWLIVALCVLLALMLACCLAMCILSRQKTRQDEHNKLYLQSVQLAEYEEEDAFAASINTMMQGAAPAPEITGGAMGAMGDAGGLAQLAVAERRESEVQRVLSRKQQLGSDDTSNLSHHKSVDGGKWNGEGVDLPGLMMGTDDAVDEVTMADDDDATFEVDAAEMEEFIQESSAALEAIDEQLDVLNNAEFHEETREVRDKLDEIRELIAKRRAEREAGGAAPEEGAKTDLGVLIADVKASLSKVEGRHRSFSATTGKSNDWNNNLLSQINKIRSKMRKIERPSLIKHRWQNAGATLWVHGLTQKIKAAAKAETLNPLVEGEEAPPAPSEEGVTGTDANVGGANGEETVVENPLTAGSTSLMM